MCGISGIYSYHPNAPSVDMTELCRIRDHLALRGPDGSGVWVCDDGRIGFGHRRLAVIDLSERAAQPMFSADGRLAITFNGEIYNYAALRKELQTKGYVFRSHSDTEVLLYLYAQKGEAMVGELRGMFAFGLWDAEKRALLLARDPYGIKPLYYSDDGKTFRFASQVKALVGGDKISRDPEPAGWVGFYLFGSVPDPYTTYEAIRAVPAGAIMWIDGRGRRAPQRYFSIAAAYCAAEQQPQRFGEAEAGAHIRDALLDSVRHHLVADVPVGAFLSAGIDSGALVGLMRDAGHESIQTITLAFDEFRGRPDDESALAGQLAARYGTCHTTRVITEQEFRDNLPKIFEAMDQPTIDGINTWFVSKIAREQGLKVAISGLGGDELFGGYPSFRDIPRWVRLLALPSRLPMAGKVFCNVIKGLNRHALRINPKTAGLLSYGGTYAGAYLLRRGLFMPWELGQVMDQHMVAEGLRRLRPLEHIAAALAPMPKTTFARIAALEGSLYMRNQLLRDTDWASMAHSLEVRVPLVDAALLEKLAGIGLGRGQRNSKSVLAEAPSRPMPRSTIQRRKTGFGVPIAKWIDRQSVISEWKRVPLLRSPQCHWSRRWAYSIACAA
jgi:asparagine synthase (glutamine-hydrolysing)